MAQSRDGVGVRLKKALKIRGLQQKDLADALGQTESAVSHYVAGTKKLSVEAAGIIADTLDTSADWLLFGKGAAPKPKADGGRQQRLEWRMRRGYADGAKDLSNPAWLVFNPTVRSIVREMLQNSADAAIDGGPVKSVIKVHSLSGAALARFAAAIGWGELQAHVRSGAAQDKTLGRTLKRGLKMMNEGPLLIATFNDYCTIGLIGSEFGSNDPTSSNRENFSALVRHTADTQKSTAGSGGSFGLGKNAAVLGSAIRTAIYNSTLLEPVDGERLNRLIGRTDLGWRIVDDEEYAGPGWFGVPQGTSKVVSSWDDKVRLHDLFLDRGDDETGTSVLIPAFHDPSGAEATIDELAKQIVTAVAEDFWPAITRGKISVHVETYDNHEQTSSVVVDPVEYRGAAVAMLQALDEGVTVDRFDSPGDVIDIDIPIEVPKRTNADGEVLSPSAVHTAKLLVSRVAVDDASHDVNRVAAFRAPGMIVEERPYSNVGLSDVKFRGILLVGLAAEETPSGEIGELFFKSAEPPAHDKWAPSAVSLNQYYHGGQARLRELQRSISEALRKALASARVHDKDGPDSIYRHFLITGNINDPPTPPPPAPRSARVHSYRWVDVDDKQLVRVTLRVPAGGVQLRVTPALSCRYEDGGGVRVPIASLSGLEGCAGDAAGDIVTDGSSTTAVFLAEPDWQAAELERRYSVLSFDIASQAKVNA